jgi:hypothetical protein
MKRMMDLMGGNHKDIKLDPSYYQDAAGLVEFFEGRFWGSRGMLMGDYKNERYFVFPLHAGIPHGFGNVVDSESQLAVDHPEFAQKIADDPGSELLSIMQREAQDPEAYVAAPFTVVVLHPDGLITDLSTQAVCQVPDELREGQQGTETKK